MAALAQARQVVNRAFRDRFAELFPVHFRRLFRVLDRLSGEPDLAADIAQQALTKLYQRGAMPDEPEAWLISVAMNLFRNVKSTRSRRRWLLSRHRGERTLGDPPPSPLQSVLAAESKGRVRAALDRLPEREQRLLLLHAEGYRYREVAKALGLHEGSIGTLLARAKASFREAYGGQGDAP